jgi:hypothetical protein
MVCLPVNVVTKSRTSAAMLSAVSPGCAYLSRCRVSSGTMISIHPSRIRLSVPSKSNNAWAGGAPACRHARSRSPFRGGSSAWPVPRRLAGSHARSWGRQYSQPARMWGLSSALACALSDEHVDAFHPIFRGCAAPGSRRACFPRAARSGRCPTRRASDRNRPRQTRAAGSVPSRAE